MRFQGLLWVAVVWGLVGSAAGAQETKKIDEGAKKKFWVFLITGKSAEGVAKEEIAAKQKAHIDNFTRLAKEGTLFLAGPLADPAKFKRGIVQLDAEDAKQLPDLFKPDPYITEEFMKLDVSEIEKMEGTRTVILKDYVMEELRIAVLDRAAGKPDGVRSPAELAAIATAHEDYWGKWRAAKKVYLRCRFTKDSPHFGVILFPKSEDAEIEKLLDGDPAVAAGAINYSLMPQYLAKGAVSVE